jgi:hypothetical protein
MSRLHDAGRDLPGRGLLATPQLVGKRGFRELVGRILRTRRRRLWRGRRMQPSLVPERLLPGKHVQAGERLDVWRLRKLVLGLHDQRSDVPRRPVLDVRNDGRRK